MNSAITVLICVDGEQVPAEVHQDPHFEEVAAMVAIEDHGTKVFLAKYCSDGRLRLGVNGGSFDEHPDPHTDEGRKEGCCLRLVANALGLPDGAPWWKQIVAFCNYADTGQPLGSRRERVEARHAYDSYAMLRLRFRDMRLRAKADGREVMDEDQLKIIRTAMEEVRLLVKDQQRFYQAMADIRERGVRTTISGPGGKDVQLVVVDSDKYHINNAARGVFGADVVVQRNTTGHVHIYTKNGVFKHLDDLAQALKIAEQEAREVVVCRDWADLRAEGVGFAGDSWYYVRPNGQFHNGTEHFRDFEPTVLSFDDIVLLIRQALDEDYFAEDDCRPASCRGSACDLYRYGFARCRQVRGIMYEAREAAKA